MRHTRVAWLRVDTQTILTIASHVITKNHRIGVTHSDHRTWYLHIRDVKESDRGWYMCQINTDPMKSQVGYLEVVEQEKYYMRRIITLSREVFYHYTIYFFHVAFIPKKKRGKSAVSYTSIFTRDMIVEPNSTTYTTELLSIDINNVFSFVSEFFNSSQGKSIVFLISSRTRECARNKPHRY
ncbi:hypothetical protein L9F63_010228, partial [Diploptera punctata]